MFDRIDGGRFQARCSACLRTSPILEGEIEHVIAKLFDLEWTRTAPRAWKCPICCSRARTEPPRARSAPPPAATRSAVRRTVLVVEDDYDAREIYRATLRHAGFRVIEAPTVKDARNAVRAILPDIVVLDWRLPDGDGLQLVNAWRDSKMGSVPVIVVSAHKERQDLDAALIAGADLFVPKPCPGNVLAAHIHRVMHAGTPTRRTRQNRAATPR
jgi:CheY-like chemotaxis protein